ncbi:hypothetical protein M8J76_005623 [Diaphorina citri]|nr:hypothetical protein M8J76_005623 [Diaphorina citri]KAI5728404.1 hypothetical protein M8J77_015735 [Diaphorina citri]
MYTTRKERSKKVCFDIESFIPKEDYNEIYLELKTELKTFQRRNLDTYSLVEAIGHLLNKLNEKYEECEAHEKNLELAKLNLVEMNDKCINMDVKMKNNEERIAIIIEENRLQITELTEEINELKTKCQALRQVKNKMEKKNISQSELIQELTEELSSSRMMSNIHYEDDTSEDNDSIRNTKSLMEELNETLGRHNASSQSTPNDSEDEEFESTIVETSKSKDLFEESDCPALDIPDEIAQHPPETHIQARESDVHAYITPEVVIHCAPDIPTQIDGHIVNNAQMKDPDSKNSKTNLFLIGDSIAASIKLMLSTKCPDNIHIADYTRGGMGFVKADQMFQEEVTEQDLAVIILGTNDLFKTTWDRIKSALDSIILKLRKCKNIFIVQILKRFDVPKINKHITNLNTRIKHYVKIHHNIKIINTKMIKFEHLNQDGIHLNNSGKNKLSHKITLTMFGKLNQNTKNNVNRNERSISFNRKKHMKRGRRSTQSNIQSNTGYPKRPMKQRFEANYRKRFISNQSSYMNNDMRFNNNGISHGSADYTWTNSHACPCIMMHAQSQVPSSLEGRLHSVPVHTRPSHPENRFTRRPQRPKQRGPAPMRHAPFIRHPTSSNTGYAAPPHPAATHGYLAPPPRAANPDYVAPPPPATNTGHVAQAPQHCPSNITNGPMQLDHPVNYHSSTNANGHQYTRNFYNRSRMLTMV